VGETTYRIARAAFEWRPVGPILVKGRETAASTHELVGRRPVRSRFDVYAQRGLTRFVGRDLEFQQLLPCWAVVVHGDPGPAVGPLEPHLDRSSRGETFSMPAGLTPR
jgi:hypothetical protein